MDLTQLLAFTMQNDASDLHLSAGSPPIIRSSGLLKRVKADPLSSDDIRTMLYSVMTEDQRAEFEKNMELDFAITGFPPDHFEVRKEFIGKQAAQAERDAGPTIRLVTLTIDTDDIDVSNDEAILKDGECVGYVTSGGYAHHVQKSMALGYVPAALASAGTALEVEINGEMYAAEIVGAPLYDPSGERMRG